ncbi:hypothetical protein [uncultured Kordia sp.]|uniref:hypothetical protein n=1 Tax=uncultured Kordia sp. TaxID=507699 RepID=UPI00261FFDBB|nr:hypothetical protein [uncultured Kordia sp.]
MSPKGILITFAVVSLLLIGIMFLAVDGRNNSVLEKHPVTETSKRSKVDEATKQEDSLKRIIQKDDPKLEDFVIRKTINPNEVLRTEAQIDSLKSIIKSQESTDKKVNLEAFNSISEVIITHIKELQEALFPGGLAAHDLGESPKITENNAVFFKENGKYTEKSTQFIAKLTAFENAIRGLQKNYPILKNIKVEVRDAYTGNMDWLDYNFKDFPAVASHSKLTQLEAAIRSKQEVIIKLILTDE